MPPDETCVYMGAQTALHVQKEVELSGACMEAHCQIEHIEIVS